MIVPFADWRPLPGRDSEPRITPRIFTVHTMAGYLKGTESTFRHDVLESHFGIGGPWDPPGLDGAIWQWQDTGRQADAQAMGNDYCVSAEVSDGGDHRRPFSERQLLALVNLGAWFAKTYNAPARLVASPAEYGIGYHQQFKAWNPHGHDCPGEVRRKQVTDVVIPRIAALLTAPPVDKEADMKIAKEAGSDRLWAIGDGVARHLDGPMYAEYRKAWPEVAEPMSRAAILSHGEIGVHT